jgi:hypothetical protein
MVLPIEAGEFSEFIAERENRSPAIGYPGDYPHTFEKIPKPGTDDMMSRLSVAPSTIFWTELTYSGCRPAYRVLSEFETPIVPAEPRPADRPVP